MHRHYTMCFLDYENLFSFFPCGYTTVSYFLHRHCSCDFSTCIIESKKGLMNRNQIDSTK